MGQNLSLPCVRVRVITHALHPALGTRQMAIQVLQISNNLGLNMHRGVPDYSSPSLDWRHTAHG